MTLDAFRASLAQPEPPTGLDPPSAALWWTAKGGWDRAHALAQAADGPAAAWVHAHLHRLDGDLGNAGYWYRRAGRPVCREPAEVEWAEMADALLG